MAAILVPAATRLDLGESEEAAYDPLASRTH